MQNPSNIPLQRLVRGKDCINNPAGNSNLDRANMDAEVENKLKENS